MIGELLDRLIGLDVAVLVIITFLLAFSEAVPFLDFAAPDEVGIVLVGVARRFGGDRVVGPRRGAAGRQNTAPCGSELPESTAPESFSSPGPADLAVRVRGPDPRLVARLFVDSGLRSGPVLGGGEVAMPGRMPIGDVTSRSLLGPPLKMAESLAHPCEARMKRHE